MSEPEKKVCPERDLWLALGDDALLRQCRFAPFRAGGPGGQKQNKTSSAIRLTHEPSLLSATAIESRSRRENTSKALGKIRMKIAEHFRLPFRGAKHFSTGISVSNDLYPLAVAELLDAMDEVLYRIRDCAEKFGISTGQLVKFIAKNPSLWQKINEERARLGCQVLI